VPVLGWRFLTNHARVLLCIAHDPGIRLRDIALDVGITERSAFAIVTDLVDAGYILKAREGRRNRYEIQHELPLLDVDGEESTIGDLLSLLTVSATKATAT
jgi:DNA-binding IclR family transcriptional regulator